MCQLDWLVFRFLFFVNWGSLPWCIFLFTFLKLCYVERFSIEVFWLLWLRFLSSQELRCWGLSRQGRLLFWLISWILSWEFWFQVVHRKRGIHRRWWELIYCWLGVLKGFRGIFWTFWFGFMWACHFSWLCFECFRNLCDWLWRRWLRLDSRSFWNFGRVLKNHSSRRTILVFSNIHWRLWLGMKFCRFRLVLKSRVDWVSFYFFLLCFSFFPWLRWQTLQYTVRLFHKHLYLRRRLL